MLDVFVVGEVEDEYSKGKRGKVCKDSIMNEAAGVLNQPCREQ